MVYPVLLLQKNLPQEQKNLAQEPSFHLFRKILWKLVAGRTAAFWSLQSGGTAGNSKRWSWRCWCWES